MVGITLMAVIVAIAPFVSSSAFIAPPNTFRLRPPLPQLSSTHIRPNISRQHLNQLTSWSEANSVTCDTKTNREKSSLVTVAETAIRWSIQYIFLRRYASFSVDIHAESNRAFLRGKFNIFILGRECVSRFNALSFQRLDIAGNNLRLGYVPFLVMCLPWIVWRLRRYIWSALLGTQLLVITGYLKSQSLQRVIQTVKDQVYTVISARESTINYSFSIVKDDVSRSFLLRYWFQSILRSLAENSVIGAAAAVGDAFEKNKKAYQNASLPRQSSTDSALVPSTSIWNDSESQSTNNRVSTSDLFAATAFKLKDVSFSKGWVILQAEALVPNDNPPNKKMLPFTVRTQIKPTFLTKDAQSKRRQQQQKMAYNAIGFLNPECRMNTNPLTAGTFLGKLIPDVVWIPFGLGVALPLGEGCQIVRAEVIDGYDGTDVFQIDGSFNILGEKKNVRSLLLV